MPRDRLVDDLWGAAPPKTATTSLHNAVGELRRALGVALVTRAPGYVLKVDPEQVDAIRFERALMAARAAEPSKRRRSFATHSASGAVRRSPEVAYEPFAEHEVARLEELKLAAKEELIDAEIELGEHDAVIGELESLVAQNPLRERLRGQQLLALYRGGRQAEALAAYQDARRALLDELGIEPGPALQQLHQSILRQDTRLVPEPSARADGPPRGGDPRGARGAPRAGTRSPGRAQRTASRRAWERNVSPFAPADEEVAEHLRPRFSLPVEAVLPVSRRSSPSPQGPARCTTSCTRCSTATSCRVPRTLCSSLPPLLRARALPHQLIVTTLLDQTLEVAFQEAGEELDVVSYISSGRDRGKFLHVEHGARRGSSRIRTPTPRSRSIAARCC